MRLSAKLVFVATIVAAAISSAAAVVANKSYSFEYASNASVKENGAGMDTAIPAGDPSKVIQAFADRKNYSFIAANGGLNPGVTNLTLHDGYEVAITVVAAAPAQTFTMTFTKPASVGKPSGIYDTIFSNLTFTGADEISVTTPSANGFGKLASITGAQTIRSALENDEAAFAVVTVSAGATVHATLASAALTVDHHSCYRVTDKGGRLFCVNFVRGAALTITVQPPPSMSPYQYALLKITGPSVLFVLSLLLSIAFAHAFYLVDPVAYLRGLEDCSLPTGLKRFLFPGGDELPSDSTFNPDEMSDSPEAFQVDPQGRRVRIPRSGTTPGNQDGSSDTEGETTDALGVSSIMVALVTLPFLLLL